MSLPLVAKHLAAHGRGPDTTLVHMAPKEVASLQALAQQHGGSLTVNPHTGLPEAGFLESLLPMALGAGAMMLPGMQGVGAGWIGAGIGALEGLRTGSLGKGLMAGLGAYGGAGMAGGLLGSGAMQGVVNEAGQDQMALLQQQQALAADKTLGVSARQAAEQQAAELSKQIAQRQAEALANQSSKSFMENLSSNFTTAGKGLTNGFGNFSNSVGMVPGAIGLKTAAAASLAPALSGAYDNNDVPVQKTSDSDRGEYAKSGAQFHPNWVGPYESKVRGGEYTYARPYYGAEGGAVGMADGGMADGGVPQHDVYQEYMDYLNNSFPSATTETVTTPPFQYTTPTPTTPTPAMPFLEAPVASNTRERGGMSSEQKEARDDPNAWHNQTDSQKAAFYANNPNWGKFDLGLQDAIGYSTLGYAAKTIGPERWDNQRLIKQGIVPTTAQDAGPPDMKALFSNYMSTNSVQDPAQKQYADNIAKLNADQQRMKANDATRELVRDSDIAAANSEKTAQQNIVTAANAAANSTYGNAPEGRTGRDAVSGDGNDRSQYGSVAAGYTGGSEAATGGLSTLHGFEHMARGGNVHGNLRPPPAFFQNGKFTTHPAKMYADGGISDTYNLGSYSDGGRLLKGPGDGVSDSIPATIGKGQPARLADGEFVIPARIVSEIGNGSTDAGARKLYAMMDRIQSSRQKTVGKGKVAVNSRADRYLPA